MPKIGGGKALAPKRENVSIKKAGEAIKADYEEGMVALEIYSKMLELIKAEGLLGVTDDNDVHVNYRNNAIPLLQLGDQSIGYQSEDNKIIIHGNGSYEFEFNDNWPDVFRAISKAQEYALDNSPREACESGPSVGLPGYK